MSAADYIASIPVAGPLIASTNAPGGHYIEAPLRQLGRGVLEGGLGAGVGGGLGALIGAITGHADLGARIGAGVGGAAGMVHGHYASRRNMQKEIEAALAAQAIQEQPVAFKEAALGGVKQAKEKDLTDRAVETAQMTGGAAVGGLGGALAGGAGLAALTSLLPTPQPRKVPMRGTGGYRTLTTRDQELARTIGALLLGGVVGGGLGTLGGLYGTRKLIDAGDAEQVPSVPMGALRGALGGLGASAGIGAIQGGLSGAYGGTASTRGLISALAGAGIGAGKAYWDKKKQEKELLQAYGYPV